MNLGYGRWQKVRKEQGEMCDLVGVTMMCETKVVEPVIKCRLRLRDVNTYPLGEAPVERRKERGEHPDERN
jgi:hypothetical protein